MSSNLYIKIQDRKTIDQEIIEQIQQYLPQDKKKLVALYYYYTIKRNLDQQIEDEIRNQRAYFEEEQLKIQQDIDQLVYGTRAPMETELKDIDQYLNEEEKQKKSEINKHLTSEPLAGYWYKAIKNCPMLKTDILERDEGVLKYLHKIDYVKEKDSFDFSLTFHFSDNDYFKNKYFTKKFIMDKNQEDMPIKTEKYVQKDKSDKNEEIDETVIDWQEGKDVTKLTKKQIQKNKKTGAKRVISRQIDDASFFSFFDEINLVSQQFKVCTEEEKGKLIEKMNIHYDIARILIDEVMPYSLEYYLGLRGRLVEEEQDNKDDVKDEKIDEDEKQQQNKKDKEKEKKDEQQKKESQQQNECKQQ